MAALGNVGWGNWISAGGSALSAVGQITGGEAQSDNLKSLAEQMDRKANERLALSTREAELDRKNSHLIVSRAATSITAAGGNASDANSIELLSRLDAEAEMRALTLLYVGSQESTNMRDQAGAYRQEADSAKMAGYIGAMTTAMSKVGEIAADWSPKKKPQPTGIRTVPLSSPMPRGKRNPLSGTFTPANSQQSFMPAKKFNPFTP
jgi:hypothetical protein